MFNINGEETIIEGGPVDAKHGYMAAKSQDPLTNHFLKAVINYPGSVEEIATDAHKGEPGYASTTIFRGDPSKLTEMLAIAVDASHYINAQQINYIPLAPFVAAQNCNTVVGTLVKAMGLPSYDSVSPTHSAPGHDRMLLPSGWESQFKGIGHTIQRTGDMPDRQRSVFERKKNGLRIEEVGAATVIYGEECSKIDMGSLCKAKAGFFNPERQPERYGSPGYEQSDSPRQTRAACNPRGRVTSSTSAQMTEDHLAHCKGLPSTHCIESIGSARLFWRILPRIIKQRHGSAQIFKIYRLICLGHPWIIPSRHSINSKQMSNAAPVLLRSGVKPNNRLLLFSFFSGGGGGLLGSFLGALYGLGLGLGAFLPLGHGSQLGLAQKTGNTVGRLCANAQPIGDALAIELHAVGMAFVEHGVIGAQLFDETAITRRAAVRQPRCDRTGASWRPDGPYGLLLPFLLSLKLNKTGHNL